MKEDGNLVIGTSVDMFGMNEGLKKVGVKLKKFSYMTLGMFGARAFYAVGKAAVNAASNLTEVQNVVEQSFKDVNEYGGVIADTTYKMEALAKNAVESYGMTEYAAKKTGSSFMAMGKAMGLDMESASDMAIELTELTGDFASFYNISQDYARVALSAVYTGETETLKRYGIILTEANLQQFALSQGIETSIHNMSAQQKLALRYNYIVSVMGDVTGDFVRTQGTWANQTRVLSQNWVQFLSIVGSGLTTVLTPLVKVLNMIVYALSKFATTVGHMLSELFGIQWDTSAVSGESDALVDLSDAAEDASDAEDELGDSIADSAKEAKKALAAYDELNVIQKDIASSAGGSGGSGGSGSSGVGDMMPLDFSLLKDDWGTAIEDMFPKVNSLYELGQYIGNALSKTLDDIDWDSIYKHASNFGKGLADFLNGLIDTDTFGEIGDTIAGTINTIVEFAYSFLDTFNVDKFGKKIAELFNRILEKTDWGKVGKALNKWATKAIKLIGKILTEINWGELLKGSGDFLQGLGPDGILALIGLSAMKGKLKKIIVSWITGVVTSALTSIGGLRGLAFTNLSTIFGAGTAAEIGVTFATGFMGSVVAAFAGWNLGQYIFDATNPDESWITDMGFMEQMETISTYSISEINDALGEAIMDFWSSTIDTVSSLNDICRDIMIGFWTFIVDTVSSINDAIGDAVSNIITTVVDWVANNLVEPISEFISELIEAIKLTLDDLWNGIVDIFNTVSDVFNTYVAEPVKNIAESLFSAITDGVSNAWSWIKDTFSSVASWVDEHIISPVSSAFSGLWDSITSGVKGAINGFIGVVESFVNHIIDTINNFTSGISTIASVASAVTGKDYSGFGQISHVSIPRLATGAVIPPNSPFMAMLGDQKSGTNIETPLDTMIEAFNTALDKHGSTNNQPIIVQIGDRQLAEIVWSEENKRYKQTGKYTPRYI